MEIKKAIITAAGYGTRFLPATKNVPKELLPVIDTPTIHYIVKNCVNAGIKDIIIVTRFGNHAVEDYFDTAPALEKYLIEKGKINEALDIQSIYKSAKFIFVRQDATLPYGNASPLFSAYELVKNEPFVYAWGDDIVIGKNAGIIETINEFKKKPSDITLFCTKVEKELIPKLGIVKFKKNSNIIDTIVEKPKLENAPSNIASVSNFVFTPKIFEFLDPKKVKKDEEFMVQNAIQKVIKTGKVTGVITKGKWFTTGDPVNYLKATVEIALYRKDINGTFKKYLRSLKV